MAISGKTKRITPILDGKIGIVQSFDTLTAGDGATKVELPGKGEMATRTTCNVFEFLQKHGVALAYIGRDGPDTFITRICDMIPIEVVVRKIATGSYLKRNPEVQEGFMFREPVVEFFLKTSGRKFENTELPCDDPMLRWDRKGSVCHLYFPDRPHEQGYICQLPYPLQEHNSLKRDLMVCERIAKRVEYLLGLAWYKLGGDLYDFKLEFGKLPDTKQIVLADVLDCDSWRVVWWRDSQNGIQLSKQKYRDGDSLEDVLAVYRVAAALTDYFPSMSV